MPISILLDRCSEELGDEVKDGDKECDACEDMKLQRRVSRGGLEDESRRLELWQRTRQEHCAARSVEQQCTEGRSEPGMTKWLTDSST